MPRLSITLSDELYNRLKIEAEKHNNSINGEIGYSLSLYFAGKVAIEIGVEKITEKFTQNDEEIK